MTTYPAFPVDLSANIKPSCYIIGCIAEPVKGVNHTGLCAEHLKRARATKHVMVNGVSYGGCLAGCMKYCEKGHWKNTGKAGEKEFVPSLQCEHLPAHMLTLAAKASSKRAA